jgi:hypothetical protein
MLEASNTIIAHAVDDHHHTAASISLAVYMIGVGTLLLICAVAILVHKKPRRPKKAKKKG